MKKMNRNLLRAMNSLLAAIIALLGVTSCNSQKKLAKGEATVEEPVVEEQPHIMVKYGVPFRKEEQTVRVMYGVPAAPAMVIEDDAEKTAKIEDQQPLYLLNGKEIPADTFSQLNPDNIAEIKVLSAEDAQKKYGDKGKNGAIEIFTKTGK